MRRRVSKEELEKILELVEQYPAGVSMGGLMSGIGSAIPRRTVSRRLATLLQQGKLYKEGRGAGVRYFIKKEIVTEITSLEFEQKQVVEDDILLSPEAQLIKSHVVQSTSKRNPVGYQKNFLESYQPNQSYYLSCETRQELADMGKQPDGEQPAGTFVRQIFNRLLIDLSWNSSRLEGNTYSLLETERLLAYGEEATGRSAFEAQMILNHKAVIEFLLDNVDEVGFDSFTIRNLHAILADNLLRNPRAGGRLRLIPVGISGTVYYPLEVPQLIEEYLEKLLDIASRIEDAFEQAFFVMVHIPYLQPFEDVNKRVSRLAANIPLMKQNFCPLSFVDVPQRAYIDGMLGVYELNRTELLRDVFVWAYKRSVMRYSAVRHSLGEPDLFKMRHREDMRQIVQEIVKNQCDQKEAIKTIQQWARQHLSQVDRAKFVEAVETELLSLHAGNIARYKLSFKEFESWQKRWH